MGWLRERLGIYGPDVVVAGVVVIISVVVASAVDVASRWAALGGVLGWVAVRALADGREMARQAKDWLIDKLKSWLADPAKRWVLGPVMRSPLTKVVVAAAVVALLGGLVWRATDGYVWVGVGAGLMMVGVGGQFWWFRGRVAEWQSANP